MKILYSKTTKRAILPFILILFFVSIFGSVFAQTNTGTTGVPVANTVSTGIDSLSASPGDYELITKNLMPGDKVSDTSENGFSDFVNLIIKIAIAMAGAIAVLIIIINGIQYLGTGSIWEKGESKLKIGSAIGGIILLLCSYIILFTINPDLVLIKIGDKKLLVDEQNWKSVNLTGFGQSGYSSGGSTNLSMTDVNDPAEICDANWPDLKCSDKIKTANCKYIAEYVDSATNDSTARKYIKAWAIEESGCEFAPANYAGLAVYGAFQFTLPTAKGNTAGCGVEASSINKEWLENKDNIPKMVCIAKNLYKYNQSVCGDNIYNVIAGLNGSAGCLNSKNCSENFTCTNEKHRAWSCIWDDNAHTQKNTGNKETRYAVQKFKHCMDSL